VRGNAALTLSRIVSLLLLQGDIYRMSTRTKKDKGEVLAKVEGSWLSHIDVDGKRYHAIVPRCTMLAPRWC
jgi:hypothetical protein